MTSASDISKSNYLQNLRDWFDNLPHWGKIASMIGGFVIFWPVGLGILGYMIWSGQMGCRSKRGEWGRSKWGGGFGGRYGSSGNVAFDEYREATLRQLEEDQREFNAFVEQLRRAKDQQEFDQFMADRMQRKTQENGVNKDESDNGAGSVPPTAQ